MIALYHCICKSTNKKRLFKEVTQKLWAKSDFVAWEHLPIPFLQDMILFHASQSASIPVSTGKFELDICWHLHYRLVLCVPMLSGMIYLDLCWSMLISMTIYWFWAVNTKVFNFTQSGTVWSVFPGLTTDQNADCLKVKTKCSDAICYSALLFSFRCHIACIMAQGLWPLIPS